MKDHQSYVVECRGAECRMSYEILAARPLTVDDKDSIRRVRCPRCKGAVNIVALGETGQWRQQGLQGRARSAAATMGGLK